MKQLCVRGLQPESISPEQARNHASCFQLNQHKAVTYTDSSCYRPYLGSRLVVFGELLLHVEGSDGGHALKRRAQETCRAMPAVKALQTNRDTFEQDHGWAGKGHPSHYGQHNSPTPTMWRSRAGMCGLILFAVETKCVGFRLAQVFVARARMRPAEYSVQANSFSAAAVRFRIS